MGCCASSPVEEPKRQEQKPKPEPNPPLIQELTFVPKSGSAGLKVFPTAAYFKPGGLSSTSALRVVEEGYVFAAMFDGLCGNEAARACKDQCYEAFAAAVQQQKQGQEEAPVDYVSALMKMFTVLDEQLIRAAAKKPYMAGMGAVGIVSVLDLQAHKLVMASVGSCHGTVGHAIGSFNQSSAEAVNMVQALMHNRPYFSSLSVLMPDLPKTQAEYALLHAVRDHILGFGIVKDSSLASAYRSSAQGRENAERGIPGDAYPTPPDPTMQEQGANGGAKGLKAAPQPVVPPGRAGWPYEEVPALEAFQGCEVQVNQRDLTMYDEHIILLSPCALSLISPSDAAGLAHAYDTPHMQLMRAAVDHIPSKPANPAPESGEGVQGGENEGEEEGRGGKQSQKAGSTDGVDQGEGQQQEQEQVQQQQQQQQLQQPLMLSSGLGGGPQALIKSTGGQEALMGSAESKGIFNVASLLVHFMTSGSRAPPSKWGEKAHRMHNTLDEDEVLPEAQAVAHPAPVSSTSPLPSRTASAAPPTPQKPASQAPPSSHPNPSDPSKATPFATEPVQCNAAEAQGLSAGDNAHTHAGSNDASAVNNGTHANNGAHVPMGSDGTHVLAHAEAHVRAHSRPLPLHLQTTSSLPSAASSPKITVPPTPNSPISLSGHRLGHHSLEVANHDKASRTSRLGAAPPKHKGLPAPRIKAQQRDAAVIVLALEWPVSLTTHQANHMRVVEASRVANPRALYRWHMVRQLVRFMGRKRVALRTCWHQTVHAAMLDALQARRDAEVLAWKELGMAVQLTSNNKVTMHNDPSMTSQQRPSNAMSTLDRSSFMSSSSSMSVPQGSALSASSEFRRSRTSKMQTMACQRPHHEPPVLLSDKWNSPSVTHQHVQPRVNTRPSSSAAGGRAPNNHYSHLSASQRPGGNAADQAKSVPKPPSSATAKSSAARAAGRQGVGSAGDSGNISRAPSKICMWMWSPLALLPQVELARPQHRVRRANPPITVGACHTPMSPAGICSHLPAASLHNLLLAVAEVPQHLPQAAAGASNPLVAGISGLQQPASLQLPLPGTSHPQPPQEPPHLQPPTEPPHLLQAKAGPHRPLQQAR